MKSNIVSGTLLAAALVLAAGAARAGTYDIDYSLVSDPSITGDLTVTTTDTPAGGPFTVTSVSGDRGGDTVTMLSSYAGSDQLLYAADPRFDFSGLSFSTASSGDFNLYSYNGGYWELSSLVDSVGYPENGAAINLTVTEVPEPASFGLFGLGLLGLAFQLRRRRPTCGVAA